MHMEEVPSGYLVEKESLWHTDSKPQKFLIDNMLMNRSSSGQTVRMNAPLFFMHIFLTMWPVSYMTTGVDNHPKCPSNNSVRKTLCACPLRHYTIPAVIAHHYSSFF